MTAQVPAYLASVFEKEHVDVEWARSETGRMGNAARDVLPDGSTVTSIDCRSTLCRLEARFPNVQSSELFIDRMFDTGADRPQFGSMIAPLRTDGPDGHSVTFYVSKDSSTPLPALALISESEE
jgi:hypothetical protein